jgi:hypothetical protein
VPSGSVREIEVPRGATSQTICIDGDRWNNSPGQPCGQNRANTIRISSFGLRPGSDLKVRIVFDTLPVDKMAALIETMTDSGMPYVAQKEILLEE